jgi:hypothetical protein
MSSVHTINRLAKCPKCGRPPLADDGAWRVLCEWCNKWLDVELGPNTTIAELTELAAEIAVRGLHLNLVARDGVWVATVERTFTGASLWEVINAVFSSVDRR